MLTEGKPPCRTKSWFLL